MRILTHLLLMSSLLCAGLARADNESDLGNAIADLNGTARLPYAKWSIYAVIALQTDVHIEKLMADRTANGLGYGELLVAESLASATGKTLPVLIAQKQKGQSWAQLAKENGIHPGSLTGRLRAAAQSMHITERSYNQQRQIDLRQNILRTHRAMPSQQKMSSIMTSRQQMAPMTGPASPRTPGSRRPR